MPAEIAGGDAGGGRAGRGGSIAAADGWRYAHHSGSGGDGRARGRSRWLLLFGAADHTGVTRAALWRRRQLAGSRMALENRGKISNTLLTEIGEIPIERTLNVSTGKMSNCNTTIEFKRQHLSSFLDCRRRLRE